MNTLKSTYRKDYTFEIIFTIYLVLVIVVTLYPFLNVLAKSFNDPLDTVKGGISIYPRKFTLQNYRDLFSKGSNLPIAFRNSVLRTGIGTLFSVLACAMFAYPLSRADFLFRKPFMRMLVITMYVGGGLIPMYMLIRNLGLLNSFWVYIIPGLVSAWNVIIIRSFMRNIPTALQESARIDGANDVRIFFEIILPLCVPVLATVALFIAVGQWNDWFSTYIYFTGQDKRTWTTLQFELMKVLDSVNMGGRVDIYSEALRNQSQRNPEAIKMAITVLVTVPILCVYPFIQRFFVTGITLGSVKE